MRVKSWAKLWYLFWNLLICHNARLTLWNEDKRQKLRQMHNDFKDMSSRQTSVVNNGVKKSISFHELRCRSKKDMISAKTIPQTGFESSRQFKWCFFIIGRLKTQERFSSSKIPEKAFSHMLVINRQVKSRANSKACQMMDSFLQDNYAEWKVSYI
jgi:hypothetical protein